MKNTTKTFLFIYTIIAVLAAIILGFLFFPKNTKTEETKLALGIATWPGFASGIVGLRKGFFDDLQLQHTKLDDASARHNAFQSGQLDIMISSVDVFAQEAAQGIKGRIFVVTDESFGGDGIVAKPDIKSPSDLKGKKVAFARATPSHFFLFKVLQKYGLSPSDIQQVIVDDPGHAGQAFIGGSVDAAVTFEPFLSQVQQEGKGHVLVTTRDYPGIVVDVLIASERLIQNPDVLRRFIEGWQRSVQYITEHQEEASGIIAKGLALKNEDVKGMMQGLRFADKHHNSLMFNDASPSKTRLAELLNDAANFWKSQNIITNIVSPDSLIYSQSYKQFQ